MKAWLCCVVLAAVCLVSAPAWAQADRDPTSAFIESVERNRMDLAKFWLERGADINMPSSRTKLPVLAATITNVHRGWVDFLLAHQAGLDWVNEAGQGPVFLLAKAPLLFYEGPWSVQLRQVLARGAGKQASQVDSTGATPLHALASIAPHPQGYFGAFDSMVSEFGIRVRMLIGAGADINAQNAAGSTPLMLTLRGDCKPRAVGILLAAGARTAAKDVEGRDARALAFARVEADSDPACKEVLAMVERAPS